MKKSLALLLALVMLSSLTAAAFAEDYEKQLGRQLSFPTTLMIGSDGCVLASIVGAAPEAYEPVIQKLLAGERNAA
ncbi:MAG: hypothetical protein IJH21_00720 [Oscillospiraceae bacterium]|nr:hypothetical protein [Oscillospiraceae bacterium]